MFNVLHIMSGAGAGGISSVVANYYQFINRDKIHFDALIADNEIGINGRRLLDLGCDIYIGCPLKSNDYNGYIKFVSHRLANGCYDAIHVHENETSWVALKVAKELGVNCRIAHAHTAGVHKGGIRKYLKNVTGQCLNYLYATNVIACGELAGNYVFGRRNMHRKKAIILPNAIDTDVYRFMPQIRKEMRHILDCENNFVIGMVGRVAYPKNNVRALELFKTILDIIPNAKLILAGDGEDMNKVKNKIKDLCIEQNVLLLGNRSDVNYLYQAFDVYMLPSLFEGFPVAAIEAMASGLPVLLSDTITKELSFGTAVHYLSLNDDLAWGMMAKAYINDSEREERSAEVKNRDLDIRDTSKILESVYLQYSKQSH